MKSVRGRILYIAIALLLMAAFVVAYISFISADSSGDIVLPQNSAGSADGSGAGDVTGFQGIDKNNVQQVVAVMARAESFHRTLSIDTYWSGGSIQDTAEIYTINSWTRINITHDGETKCVILSEDTCWIWYSGEKRYYSVPRGDFSSETETRIPDYTDILALNKGSITDAGLEARDGVMCIYVAFSTDNRSDKYWLDLDSGLLNSAESWEGGQLVYLMEQTELKTPFTSESDIAAAFTLPDGTLLYD